MEKGLIAGIADIIIGEGALKAEYVPSEKIAVSEEFRRMCEMNSCGVYGRCWMCPPAIGDISPLMEEVRSYKGGILYQTVHELEDSFDFEGMMEAKRIHSMLSIRIQNSVSKIMSGGFLHLSCGGCFLCDSCAILTGEPCRHPDKAISSMEAYGIDVYRTAMDTGLKYINGNDTVTYFGIVLINN